MNDKYLAENVMFGHKVVSDLLLHGTIESKNEKVYLAFAKALSEVLKMHNEFFKEMEKCGFYSISNIAESQIKEKKKSLECTCENCLEED